MCAFRNRKAIIRSRAGVGGICSLAQRTPVFLVPDVREAFKEEQREDVLFVVPRVDQPAKQVGGSPQIRLKLLLAQMLRSLAHDSQPPSRRTSRSRSSAARASPIVCLKAAIASGSGGISSPIGGST